MRSVPGSASALIVANTYGKGEMNMQMIIAAVPWPARNTPAAVVAFRDKGRFAIG